MGATSSHEPFQSNVDEPESKGFKETVYEDLREIVEGEWECNTLGEHSIVNLSPTFLSQNPALQTHQPQLDLHRLTLRVIPKVLQQTNSSSIPAIFHPSSQTTPTQPLTLDNYLKELQNSPITIGTQDASFRVKQSAINPNSQQQISSVLSFSFFFFFKKKGLTLIKSFRILFITFYQPFSLMLCIINFLVIKN